jgi:transposase-like protein
MGSDPFAPPPHHVEVITSVQRRYRWSTADKVRLVEEAMQPGMSVAALTDALNRHRGKGQQVVRVEHVHVHPGAQAIVGVAQEDRVESENEERPHAPRSIAHKPEPALRRQDSPRQPVPVSDGKEQATLQDARRGSRQRSTGR